MASPTNLTPADPTEGHYELSELLMNESKTMKIRRESLKQHAHENIEDKIDGMGVVSPINTKKRSIVNA